RELRHRHYAHVPQLHEDAPDITVRGDLHHHGAHTFVELDVPTTRLGLEIEHAQELVPDRAGIGVLAVGRHVDVVHAPVERDRLGERERPGVNDIEPALVFRYADNDPGAVPGDRDVVGVAAQGHLLDDLAGLAVHDVERAVGLVAHVHARAVGSEVDAVGRLDSPDHLHDLVRRRVDDVNI